MIAFADAFAKLTGHPPFPWQTALYDDWFSQGKAPPSCNLPTGLGKTSVIAVWLIALANGAAVPRRLVYVVNRLTVVDQTTDEVEKYKKNLTAAGITQPLAVSTLRGQYADNREWSGDPSRPAVICRTVDMIGSRLLFSGYGVGMKGKPLHAGFLGQDALLVHDDAHLEPAFQTLLDTIRDEQARCRDFRPLRVMELIDRPPTALASDPNLGPYLGEGCVWSTVTPVVLHRHDLDDPDEVRRRMTEAFRYAGIADELLADAEVEWGRFGYRAGVEPAGRYVPADTMTGPRYHVRVTFRLPVRGPLAVGAGRYRGFGLFARDG